VNTETLETTLPAPRGSKRKGILIGVGIAVLVLLLAAAAFVGGRLLNGEGIPGLLSRGVHSPDLIKLPAKELPQTPADVNGIFDHRQDKSIFVGTGHITGSKGQDSSGNVHISLSHDGPVIEVVVTTQTIIYKDTTQQQFNGRPPHQGQIQQVVEPGSVDEMGQLSMITVWGRKTGDRYIADVLVYTPPPVIGK
jgi:hypothetical protein